MCWSWCTGGAGQEGERTELGLMFSSINIMERQRGERVENLGQSMVKRETLRLRLERRWVGMSSDNRRVKENGRVVEVEFEMLLKSKYQGFRK